MIPLPPPPEPPHVRRPSWSGLGDRLPVPWPWWEAIFVYLAGGFLLGGAAAALVAGTGTSDEALVVESLAADVVLVVSMVLWLRWRHPGWTERVGVEVRVRDAVRGYLSGLALYPVIAILGIPLGWVFERLVGHAIQQPEQLSPDTRTAFKVLAVVLAVVVAPVAEELFFRGMLYRSIRDRHGVVAGLACSSVLFGLVHYVPAPAADAVFLQVVMVFTGIGLALIYERRGNLLGSIAAHAAFNTIGVILILGRF